MAWTTGVAPGGVAGVVRGTRASCGPASDGTRMPPTGAWMAVGRLAWRTPPSCAPLPRPRLMPPKLRPPPNAPPTKPPADASVTKTLLSVATATRARMDRRGVWENFIMALSCLVLPTTIGRLPCRQPFTGERVRAVPRVTRRPSARRVAQATRDRRQDRKLAAYARSGASCCGRADEYPCASAAAPGRRATVRELAAGPRSTDALSDAV